MSGDLAAFDAGCWASAVDELGEVSEVSENEGDAGDEDIFGEGLNDGQVVPVAAPEDMDPLRSAFSMAHHDRKQFRKSVSNCFRSVNTPLGRSCTMHGAIRVPTHQTH